MAKIEIQEVKIPNGKELLEDSYPLSFTLEESADGKKPYLKGKFGQVDTATANRRIYPRKVMSAQFARVQESIEGRCFYGELDHPSGDGRTKASRVSHLVTGLKLYEDGHFDGIVEFIPGTINGDQALAIARAGGKLGISSRGYGTTIPDAKGNSIVQEDYHMVAFDLVIDPANAGAFPNFVVESKEEDNMDLKTLKKEHPELIEALVAETRKVIEEEARNHARDALREDFEKQLKDSAVEIRDEVLKEARSELLSDPEVAGSKAAIEKVAKVVAPFLLRENEGSVINDLEKRLQEAEKKLAEADEKNAEANVEAEELAELAKEAFFHLYLEQTLHSDERREQIEGMLGDVTQFDSLDDLKERVEEIQEALSGDDEVKEEYDRDIARLEAEKKQLEEELETALTVSNQFAAKAYIERKLGRHPKADKVRTFLDEAGPIVSEDVDRLVEAFDAEFPASDEYDKIRGGLEKKRETHKGNGRPSANGGKVFGVNIEELAEAAGVHKDEEEEE